MCAEKHDFLSARLLAVSGLTEILPNFSSLQELLTVVPILNWFEIWGIFKTLLIHIFSS